MCVHHGVAKCQGSDYELNALLYGCQCYVRARGVQDTQRWAFTQAHLLPGLMCMRVCVCACLCVSVCFCVRVCVCVCGLLKAVMQALHAGSKSCFIPFTSPFLLLASLEEKSSFRPFSILRKHPARFLNLLNIFSQCSAHSG